MRWRLVAWLVLVAPGLTGCFIGYDSRWGQQKRAQQRAATAAMPESLRTEPQRPGALRRAEAPNGRDLSLRLAVTPACTAQVVDWQRRFDETLAAVNAIVGSDFGVTLTPLFPRYPEHRLLAELRCNIAMRRGLPVETIHDECAAFMRGAQGSR